MHIHTVSAAATAAATTGTAATALTGDSLTVLNANPNKRADIIAMWQTNQTAGFGQITFPSAHDTTRGYRAGVPIGTQPALLPLGQSMRVYPQEVMAVTIAATAVAGDVENWTALIRYQDMPGIEQRLISNAELARRTELLTTIEASLTSAAGPAYSGTELINADSDLLKANRDYAVLGFSCRTALHLAGIVGPDTANVRISCPCLLREELTSQWFPLLSRAHGEPLIPVINSGNRNATSFFCATNENAGTFVITCYLALLK